MAVTALGALLGIVTLLGGFASGRLHGAYREALRDLRESERRLDAREAGHVDSRLEPELRWLAEIRDADRDSRWRESTLLMAVLSGVAVTLAVWTLVQGVRAAEAFAVIALALGTVLVTVLSAWDGRRIGRTLAATTRQSRLWGLLRLENALSETQRATARQDAAHRAWLRALAARQPLAGMVARWRERQFRRASARRQRAVDRLPTPSSAVGVLDQLRGVGVRPPAGYVDGLRGLLPLVGRDAPRLDDDADWDATLADLTRAVEQDPARRLRWLSALAACAELRDDPVARESAARWALDVAACSSETARRGVAADRYDPLPDAELASPLRPTTWAGALRRARDTGAPASLLAAVLVRWAYALVLDRADHDVDAAITPAVDAGVEIMHALPEREADRYLRLVRAGLADLGASGAQMSRLVPPRSVPPAAPAGSPDDRTVTLPTGSPQDPTVVLRGGSGQDPTVALRPGSTVAVQSGSGQDPTVALRGGVHDDPTAAGPAEGAPPDPALSRRDQPPSPTPYDPVGAPPAPRAGDRPTSAESVPGGDRPGGDRPGGGATVAEDPRGVTADRSSGGATAAEPPPRTTTTGA